MNIGIDLDGVITNLDNLDNLLLDKKIAHNLQFWIVKKASMHAGIKSEASKVIRLLKKDGNNIIIITKRRFSTEDSREGTTIRLLIELYLNENEIPYNKIIFTDDKTKECLEEKIDVMIEANADNINDISKYIPVICFDNQFNHNLKGYNIYNTNDWFDIYMTLFEKYQKEGRILIYEKD